MSLFNLIGANDFMSAASKIIDKIIPDDQEKQAALLNLESLKQSGDLQKIFSESKDYEVEQTNITNRWASDSSSESWLSKNVRPLSLLLMFFSYVFFGVMIAAGHSIPPNYISILDNWGMVMIGAYFGGKTLERIIGKTK